MIYNQLRSPGDSMSLGLTLLLAVQAFEPAGPSELHPDQTLIGIAKKSPKAEIQEMEIPETETEATALQILPKDTPVHLMVLNEVTTKTHQAGHRFKLRVNKPVMLDGRVIMPVGALAWGEVTAADDSGNVGRSGKMAANLLYVDVNGTRFPISGGTTSKGKSGTAETIMGVLALGPLGLFAKGNNAKIKAGELMTAFTSESVTVPSAN
ncbi:hypothetical protein SPHFLASMR4Y_01609 [Sphingorhabdus sp. SMR4y]|nr:hypothetical protein SPHFLASMR4Y_01609 [Sphingorhabdus sp. SMR4y]